MPNWLVYYKNKNSILHNKQAVNDSATRQFCRPTSTTNRPILLYRASVMARYSFLVVGCTAVLLLLLLQLQQHQAAAWQTPSPFGRQPQTSTGLFLSNHQNNAVSRQLVPDGQTQQQESRATAFGSKLEQFAKLKSLEQRLETLQEEQVGKEESYQERIRTVMEEMEYVVVFVIVVRILLLFLFLLLWFGSHPILLRILLFSSYLLAAKKKRICWERCSSLRTNCNRYVRR